MELLATSNEDSALRNVNYNDLDSKMIYTSALAGDKLAIEAFEITGKILGLKLADAVAVTSPEAIVLFGGLALAGDMIISPTKNLWKKIYSTYLETKLKFFHLACQKETAQY